ncbi:hypothetical protein GCM10023114_12390 [Mycolicibacterium sediminis]|uniref:Luciferase-like domain-containing protein n=1 Tax=Mycolicibacterium sediminis TaxID=1286180 RepID=A0A7I7QSF0_9MYCO|nr:hypothetical protein MSEDJ_29930 [Mycolicibacterium sediminis]
MVFPQTEIGDDVGAIRAYAEAVAEFGFRHVMTYDHVVGADPAAHPDWPAPYDVHTTFHEPFVLFGFLAALTDLELVTGIIILPQRQTVLVAKQAAEVDLLSNGRLRLGVGIGWNWVEYEALGKDFAGRGVRSEEQVGLLRRLWTEGSVTHDGPSEHVTGAGLSPLPVQRPISIWFGGSSARAYRRAGRIGDGWFPQMGPGRELDAAKDVVDAAAIAAGRDPSAVGMDGRSGWASAGLTGVLTEAELWRSAGATHLSINTMDAGLGSVDGHIAALGAVAGGLGLTRRPA